MVPISQVISLENVKYLLQSRTAGARLVGGYSERDGELFLRVAAFTKSQQLGEIPPMEAAVTAATRGP